MEIRIGAVDLHGLVPQHRLQPELRLPVKLDERRLVLRIDETERVNAEPFHEAERARDGPVRHHPHDHVHAFRGQADEIPEIVVSGLRLRKGAVRLLLHRMNEVRKLDRVLDEEHRNVVADDVPVAFLGIELDGKPAYIARQIERALCCPPPSRTARRPAFARRRAETGRHGCISKAACSSRRSRARRSRGHAPPAPECARGRSGRSSRENGNLRAALVRAGRS